MCVRRRTPQQSKRRLRRSDQQLIFSLSTVPFALPCLPGYAGGRFFTLSAEQKVLGFLSRPFHPRTLQWDGRGTRATEVTRHPGDLLFAAFHQNWCKRRVSILPFPCMQFRPFFECQQRFTCLVQLCPDSVAFASLPACSSLLPVDTLPTFAFHQRLLIVFSVSLFPLFFVFPRSLLRSVSSVRFCGSVQQLASASVQPCRGSGGRRGERLAVSEEKRQTRHNGEEAGDGDRTEIIHEAALQGETERLRGDNLLTEGTEASRTGN